MQKVLSGRQYQDGRWTSGVGKAVHSLHGVPACLSPGGDTVWKNDTEEGAVPVDRLLIGYRYLVCPYDEHIPFYGLYFACLHNVGAVYLYKQVVGQKFQ